jgi:hypothetical protein
MFPRLLPGKTEGAGHSGTAVPGPFNLKFILVQLDNCVKKAHLYIFSVFFLQPAAIRVPKPKAAKSTRDDIKTTNFYHLFTKNNKKS